MSQLTGLQNKFRTTLPNFISDKQEITMPSLPLKLVLLVCWLSIANLLAEPTASETYNRPQKSRRIYQQQGSRSRVKTPVKYNKDYSKWQGLVHGCGCSEIGSVGRSCDIVTGQCQCRPNVAGRACDQCQEGFWNLQSRKGCQPCLCDPLGSFNETCDPVNGQCPCKPGITGKSCDSCSTGFFGFSALGCKQCDPCDKPGHVCDPDTGRCVCPPFTEGSACERCSPGSWAYDPVKGCKSCNCRPEGSRSSQCDERSGQCSCREGYEGPLCDRCQFGYYGFPQCRKCNCNIEGTDPSVCDLNGLCQCASDGQCTCRANVMGAKCDRCKENTFGLQQENEFGCTQCFCFTRTTTCTQANYVWTQLRGQTSGRILRINYDHPLRPPNAVSANQFPVNTQEICYINLAIPGQRELKFKPGETRLNITNNLRIVPGTTGDVMIGVSQMFDTPVYWRLPEIFLRDKVASYNGYLRFTVNSDGGSTILPGNILATYPLVQIQGNSRVILEYFPTQPSPTGRYEVRLHENYWKVRNNPRQRATREMLMVALQNLQHILVRATDSMDRSRAELTDVSLDYAVPAAGASQWSHLNVAKGVELCQCPLGYNGTSCQDPSVGFYRYYKSDHVSSTVIIDLVGEAAPCQCNGRSETCHKETGICSNCRENTAGPRCDICAPGYFGDPNRDGCRPCACPTPDRNFAESCEVSSSGYQKCSCKKGYRGERCERCEYGYYGNPLAPGGQCQPCNCVTDGSVSDECDEITGQCNCKPGITGRDCSSCAPRHVITSSGCSSCESGCTGILFQDIDAMSRSIQHLNFSNYVPVPWTGLFDHENQTVALEMELKKHVEDNDLAQRLAQTPNLIPLAQITLERVKELENEALKVVPDLLELKPEAHAVEEEIRTIRRNCEDVIAHMKNYAIGETSSVNIHKAVAEAEGHLKFILSLDFSTSEAVARKELERARNLVLSVKNLFHDVGELDQVRDKLEGIRFRIEDLETQIRKSQDTTNQALKTIAAGNASLAGARSPVGLITEFSSKTDTRNTAARKLNANATNALKEARSNYQDLRISLENLRNRTNQCEIKTERLSRLNPEYRSRFVIPAQEHANNLWNQAQDLFNQFNETRDVADLPLQAANAYKGIVDALSDAEKAAGDATDAADTAYEEAYPDDLELSLLEQARLSRKKSQDFLQQSEKLRDSVLEHGEKLKGERGLLENVEKILEQVRTSHSESILLLNNLPKVRDRAKAAVDKSTDAFTKTLATSRRVVNISALVESDLKARLLALQTGRSVGYGDAPSLIEESRKNSKIIESKISHLTKKSFELRSMNSSISVKLDELRRKIMRAKQAASSIRVSLSGKDGSCVRTYKPPLQPGSMSSIVIHYAIYGKEKNSMLFYLPASKKHGTDPQADFLAVEMVDRKIRFVWNVGGGVQSITNPYEILPSPEDLSDDSRWYRIEAERIGNIGTLTVRPMKGDDSILSNSGTTVSGASPARFTKLDLMSGDRLYIGGLPKNSSADLKSKKLAGCIHQVWLDGQPIGLWNFETSTKCNACIEGAQEAEDESSFHFRGNGYSELPQIPRYDSRQYSVTFSFRTFDENALLFLAINDTLGQYVSLELVGGVLRYEVRYGLQHELSLQSRNKYNNGQWIKVEASRVLLRGVETALLKVDDEELSAAPFNSEVPDLDLEIAKLYVGGIPPDVKIPQQLMPSLPGSFLGCMKDLQVVAFGLNPLQGSYYGVEASCPSKSQRSVAFSGRGFVELKTPAWRKDGTFGVSFKSFQPDGILLVSTNSVGDMQSDTSAASSEDANDNLVSMALRDRDPDSFSIALRHGKLEIRSRSGLSGETNSVVSSDTYNDGLFHTVVIIRSGRKMDILVDDANVGTIRLPKAAGSSSGGAAEHSVLFLGGTRTDFNAADLLGTTQSLEGCIADIMLNNELLGLDNPVRFKDAAIGRCDNVPAPRVVEERMQANEIALSRCREVPQYTIEGRAVKFGDAPNSHVIISTNRKELHSVFNVTLDFRTFYPNGLLLFSTLKKKKMVNMLMVALKNGRVVVSLHGRRKQDITSVDNLNDGKWHKIHVVKDKRKISLFVDDMPPTRSKAPNAIQVDGQLFVGGLSDASQIIENMVVDGFKGCIRNLNLNGRTQDLASGKNVVQRVGQCFAHVERGSYFPGDAYAVYSEDFRVGAMADIELEFRTTEMNGVLLSVSELRGSPALSLSIEEGVVIMAVDMGDNHTFSVRQRFTTPYHICDNRWHSIKASYVENALTLKVDNMDQQYGFSTNGEVRETKTKSPLYIGGLPDGAPRGTLQIRDNFKGCIRNLVIRGDFRDWTDMSRLNNVLLNACPIQ